MLAIVRDVVSVTVEPETATPVTVCAPPVLVSAKADAAGTLLALSALEYVSVTVLDEALADAEDSIGAATGLITWTTL